MLLYLFMNTRPDIAFAVSHLAQFTSNHKQSHASAVMMIIRYLSATSDQGIIFTHTTEFKVECYVDADFAGLHDREPPDLSASAHSHTGYIMFFCSCHLIWKSQLQTKTALSTFHAEYVALSSAIRSSSPSNELSKNLSTAYTCLTKLLSSTLKFLKITTQPTSLLQTTAFLSTPSTSILSGISFGNMWMKNM